MQSYFLMFTLIKVILKFFRYAEEDKEIERERREAGKNNNWLLINPFSVFSLALCVISKMAQNTCKKV